MNGNNTKVERSTSALQRLKLEMSTIESMFGSKFGFAARFSFIWHNCGQNF